MAEARSTEQARQQSGIARWVESALGRVALAAYRRPGPVLVAMLVSAAVAIGLTTKLKVSADLAELLPKSFQSVQDLGALKERVGGIGYVVIVARGPDPAELRRFADVAGPKIAESPDVRYVDSRRPIEFFEDRALYYMELDDLETVRDRLVDRKDYEVAKRNPLYFDLEEEEEKVPPSIDFSDLEKKYKSSSDQAAARLRNDEPYYLSKDEKTIALFIKPDSLSADLKFARRVVKSVKDTLGAIDLGQFGDGFEVELSGTFVRKVEQQDHITGDLGKASVAALAMMLLFIGAYFRSARAVVVVIVPLVIGIAWTFAFALLAFDNLNILTSFLGAILLGLGVDHGIHLFARHDAERHREGTTEERIERSFATTGRAAAVAGLTTAVGFAGLATSEFRAFHEFGLMAAVGTVFVLVAYLLACPALIRVLLVSTEPKKRRAGPSPWARLLTSRPGAALGVFVALLALAGSQVGRIQFNFDFLAIQGSHLRSFQLDAQVNEMLGRSQSPVVIPTDSPEEERAVANALADGMKERGDQTTIDFVLSFDKLVPSEQEEKRELLDDIADAVRKVKPEWLEPDQRKRLEDLKRMVAPQPFDREALPAEVTRQLRGPKSPPNQSAVLVFPNVSQSDGQAVRRLAAELRSAKLPSGEALRPAAEAMIMADILTMVITESPKVLAITFVALSLTLLFLMARWTDALVCLIAGALTIPATLALLPVLGVQLNYLNIVIIPVLFGLAVDGSVHMFSRFRSGASLEEAVDDTGRAIFAALSTTALGFGALILSDHPGLDSIGRLAVTGLFVNACVTLVGVPGWLGVFGGRR